MAGDGARSAAIGVDDNRHLPQVATIGIIGWILFEFAAQPFYSLITTFLFAPYFANVYVGDSVRGLSMWGYTVSAAGLCVALLSPILGAMADASRSRKPWVLAASLLLVTGMASLWIADPARRDLVYYVLGAFVMASVAAELNGAFVNAIMPRLVPPSQFGRLSGISVAIAYLGGLIALVLAAGFIIADPATGRTTFGFSPLLPLDQASHQGERFVGPFCALWYTVFVLPFFLFTPDPPHPGTASPTPVRDGLRAIRQTAGEIGRYGNVVRFLVARMLYQDGLFGLFAFAGIYGESIFGWKTFETGVFGIVLIVAAMLGALIGGFAEGRVGTRSVIMSALVLAMLGTLGVLSIDAGHVLFSLEVAPKAAGSSVFSSTGEQVFLVSAILVGLVAGPLNSSSRSLMAQLSPPEKAAQFFGFYALSGKATSFVAPALIALITQVSGSSRLGVAVVIVLLTAGFLLMTLVRRQVAAGDDEATPGPAATVPATGPGRDHLGSLLVAGLFLLALAVIATT